MPALVVLYNLKDEAAREAYEAWAQSTDVPTVKKLASVDDFKVFKMNAIMGSEDAPPYQYCEVLEINDMDQLGKDVSTETMKQVAAEFQEFADNPIFIVSDQIA